MRSRKGGTHGQHINAVKQVAAESAASCCLFQSTADGTDQAQIEHAALQADTAEVTILKIPVTTSFAAQRSPQI